MLDRKGPNATPVWRVDVSRTGVTTDSGSDAGFTTDPGIRLLTKIGDFVEPLTRFDRGHLTLESSQHESVDVIARQVFRVAFETVRSEGNGGLPEGVVQAANVAAMARASEAQLAASRAAVRTRLSAWAAEHGETPTAKPAVSDCFTTLAPIGHVATCEPCQGAGKIPCSLCQAAGTLTCEACEGRGGNPCTACNATGEVTCKTCKGMRTVVTHKERKVYDEETNSHRVEHVQETVTCETCNGAGLTKCGKCNGRTTITCASCHGQKTIPCTQCQGSGYLRCETCGGEGRRHFVTRIECAIRETFETTARASDPETAAVLKRLNSIDKVLGLAGSYRVVAETSADTLSRDTRAVTPVTTVTVVAGGARAQVQAYGPQQDVLDYRNIAGMLLSDDLRVLEDRLQTTRLLPPRVDAGLHESLATVLASEANVAIVENAAKKDQSGIVGLFKGVVTADYIARAGAAMKKAMTRSYATSMARGPVAVLAIPLIHMPIDLIVRGTGQGGRLMALLGVMLMTFFAALAAHYWVVHKLQETLAPGGAPKIPRIVDKLNLTLQWLVAAAGVAAVLTLAAASLTGLLFPMAPAVVSVP